MRFNRSVLYAVTLIVLVLHLGGCQPSQSTPRTALEDLGARGSPVPTGVVQFTPTETSVPTRQPVTESTPTHPSDVEPARTSARSAPTAASPSEPTTANLLGHKFEGNGLTFVFDEAFYGLQGEASSVAVAGNFNEWDNAAPEWQLRDDDNDGVWTLQVPPANPIRPGAAFIFLADGRRLQPPSGIDPNYLLPDAEGGFLLVLGGLADLPEHDEIISRLERKSYTDAQGETLPYHLLIPQDYDPSQAYPLVIFLHGSGERGDNLAPVLPYNGAYEFMETARKVSYFMLIPQAPNGTWWDSSDLARQVLGLLDEARGQFSINPARIYITGLSMGAFGMWRIVSQEPQVFAAGISVCGGLRDTSAASKIAHIPFEVFHGSDDSIVPVAASRATVNALQKAGGAVEYVEYKGADHWIWQRTYTSPEVIDWLFAQKK
jgi:predicted esterase